jgi:uncharacterized protein (TIGR03086 family)
MSDAAERHRAYAATFERRVRGVVAWDAPTPVPEWTARDVVRHLVEWFPPFLADGSGIRLAAGPSVDGDPVTAWTHQASEIQAVLDDPAAADVTFAHPHIPPCPLPEAIDRFYTTDVFMHTWDLARATGQDDQLDAAECQALLEGMEPLDEMLRASGQYGPRVPVADDADVQARLVAFIGRDPAWSPASPVISRS